VRAGGARGPVGRRHLVVDEAHQPAEQGSGDAVGRHLRHPDDGVERDAKGIGSSVRRHGRPRLYRLHPRRLQDVVSWIDEFAAFFGQRLDALGEYLDRKPGKRGYGAPPGIPKPCRSHAERPREEWDTARPAGGHARLHRAEPPLDGVRT